MSEQAEWRRRVWRLNNSIWWRLAVLMGLGVSPSVGRSPRSRRRVG